MGDLVNHLKNAEPHTLILARAAGEHMVDGHLLWSYSTGAEPNHTVYARYALATGIWEGPVGVWFDGINIPSGSYIFHDGTQTESGAYFPMDSAHTGTVMIDLAIPGNLTPADTEKNPPNLFAGRFKCEKFPAFDDAGNQIVPADYVGAGLAPGAIVATPAQPLNKQYFTYTTKPFRALAGWYFDCSLDPVRSDFNYAVNNVWDAYCSALSVIDYTTLEKGFGLTARYYSGTNFQTFLSQRIDPAVQFDLSDGAPAVGIPIDNFSVEWTGKIKPEFTETYTFKVVHDDGARLSVNGVQLINEWSDTGQGQALGTHSGTINLVAGQLYDIKAEWNEGGGPGEFRLFWSSPSRSEEIIPYDRMYPANASQENYRLDEAFSIPHTMDAVIERIMLVTNSLRQDVNGKMEFRCIEQLTPTFHFREGEEHILQEEKTGRDLLAWRDDRNDVRVNEPPNVWTANVLLLESQYLEKPIEPIQINFADLYAASGNRSIYATLNLGSMNTIQAYKVLDYQAKRAAAFGKQITVDARAATYRNIANDLVEFTHSVSDEFQAKKFIVVEAADRSNEETANLRIYRIAEWID